LSAARRWIDAWVRAWTTHDAEALAPVYAAGALHRSEPFRERGDPRAYAVWAFGDEDEVECWFAEPWLETAAGAACEWWAVSRLGETVVTLAGVSLRRFEGTGAVVEQSDYWSQADGRRPPPDGWGPAAAHGAGPS
jgi:hypothetical protein